MERYKKYAALMLAYLGLFCVLVSVMGCGEDATEPGNTPDVVSCGDWTMVEQNYCGGFWTRVCKIDSGRCFQSWLCGQTFLDCQ